MLKELLEDIAKELVDYPEDVSVAVTEGELSTILQLSVNSEDAGKVIGRQGRIAKAIRSLMKAAAIKENTRVSVEIV